MAKKKENQLNYLQMPLPEGTKHSKMTKRSWSGLNYRQTIDTGMLSMERNISTAEAPYLVPSPMMEAYMTGYNSTEGPTVPIGLFGFDDFLIVIYRKGSIIYVDYITHADGDNGIIFTGILKTNATSKDEYPRSVVQFNAYDTPTDPVDGRYVKKLLFFPDKASMTMRMEDASSDPRDWYQDEGEIGTVYRYKDTEYEYLYYEIGTDTDSRGNVVRSITLLNHEEKNDEGKRTRYPYFSLAGLDAVVKKFRTWVKTVIDEETGEKTKEKVETPPENADKACYYENLDTHVIYRYCEYETPKKDENGEPVKDEDGNYIYEGDTEFGWKASVPPSVPPIKYATVHLSRVFGVDEDTVYASGFNDYGNWSLDTVGEYNESNAWCSPSQSNTKADGVFTGITTFQNHVVCFKRDFMHEIYNTKNPFRVQDIYAEGAIDNRTIQDVGGRLIFVSSDEVKVYTGSNPRILGYNLNLSPIEYAVSGTDGRNYYLYCETKKENHFFVYDTYIDQWSEREMSHPVINFAHNKNGMYALCEDGVIYQLDTDYYPEDYIWSFETDLFTNETVDIKHIKKLQMFADIGKNSGIKVYFLYDDEVLNEKSHLVYDSKGTEGRKAIRVKPRQTAHYGFKVHVEGHGYVRLYEMEIEMQAGGGLYV